MKTFFKKLLLVVAVFYLPLQSMAWGTQGHRICGQIANNYLTPQARKAIEAILGNESIAMASNWADFIKSDPTYNYLSVWHYIDFDKAYSYPEMVEYLNRDVNVDAYTKLNFLIAELKKKDLSKENKLLYLRMLIHIIEDVHQPMHTAHADDKGGNDFKVNWFSTSTNLHSVWDSQLIDFQQLSYTEYATWINHSTLTQRTAWQKEPISQWLFESNQIAEKLYTEIKPGDTLNYKYNFTHIEIVNQQLLKAGVRLAGILNTIFG
ncbi:S1/P1 nuclease [Mucilaginibacter frigoritolerans]|uniref:S1/P1 nuclease n=1 Tax=Mucilaginibacter frigoritolerans TaxID=652788 RepID=A0A562TYS6_9SPHI|nr:S1/P1 nuclease [Mucilaginibacter frigoritolerans]TWI98745.1 S1/P1 nuclease [Mucilaginibacter frigoritolerans]